MLENGVYTSLDIGTTSIKAIVSEVLNGKMNVIGVGSVKSKGLKKGMVVDIDETVQSIKQAVQQAEEKSGVHISQLIVGVPANGVLIESCHGVVQVSDTEQEISDQDIEKVVSNVLEQTTPSDRNLLSIMLEEFVVDGFDGIKDPRGMVGDKLEIYGTIISAPKTILHNIKKCVENAGYMIQNLVLQPEAMAQLVLSIEEREFGTVQIDLGGGQTTVSAVHDDQVKFAYVKQIGGEYITKDISTVLNTSIKNAERLKRDMGYAFSSDVNDESTVQVDVVGEKEPIAIKESFIAEVIEARVADIFEQLKIELDRIGALELPGGVKLSGGVAAIPGIKELAEDIFDVKVDVYIPDFMSVRYPTFTNGIGLVYYEASLKGIDRLITQTTLSSKDVSNVSLNEKVDTPVKSKNVSNHTDDNPSDETFGEKFKNLISKFFD